MEVYERLLTPGAPSGSLGRLSAAVHLWGGSRDGGTSSPGLSEQDPKLFGSFVLSRSCVLSPESVHVVESRFALGDRTNGGVLFPAVHSVRANAVPAGFKDGIFLVFYGCNVHSATATEGCRTKTCPCFECSHALQTVRAWLRGWPCSRSSLPSNYPAAVNTCISGQFVQLCSRGEVSNIVNMLTEI